MTQTYGEGSIAELVRILLGGLLGVAFWGGLILLGLSLLTGRSGLIWEHHVQPGEAYDIPNYGRITGDFLICRYVDVRGERYRVYQFSPSGAMGRDRCPTSLSASE